jgi:predicted nucleotidyltransferase
MPVPEPQRSFLEQILASLKTDDRLLGIAIGGSYLSGEMDEYSDLELAIIVEEVHYKQVLKSLLPRLSKVLQWSVATSIVAEL